MNPAQCRAARALVDYSQEGLAEKAGVSVSTIRDFESDKRAPREANLAAIIGALEKAGAVAIGDGEASATGGAGVRLRKRDSRK